MVVFLFVLWTIDLVNRYDHRQLVADYGIRPRQADRLVAVLTAPFLHVSAAHLAANGLPLFGLGLVVAVAGFRRFLGVTAVIILISGLAVWLFAPSNTVTVGASGVVFGLFGYLVLRGLLDRRPLDLMVAVGVAISYGSLLGGGMLPSQQGMISWQGHAGGFLGGLIAAWLFRRRRPRPEPVVAPGPAGPGATTDPAGHDGPPTPDRGPTSAV
ncbi:MAG: rhomboid family intramembrane serine protease [Actinobacteria bacterium]|nr:rhomboid family intramembrane serine protease [Actinomycetota bacterium]MBI3686511.1 rhomboid family intramembrane serine protease [Actinomycetota bacterium]